MAYRSIVFLFLVFFLETSWGRSLSIGCAYTCDSYTKKALLSSSKTHNVKLSLFDLSIRKQVEWKKLDGIVIPGGADIDPKFYLQQVEADLQQHIRNLDHLVEYTQEGKNRDAFEYNLLREYYRSPDLATFPVLGLCRGMQIMTVALGIPLYVDIETELQIPNRRDLYDTIEVSDSGSLMTKLFPMKSFPGYKFHHQGLRVPYYLKHQNRWPNVKVTAFSNRGRIAEGLEITDRPALGVQFHPEADSNSVRKAIFDWFILKAMQRQETMDRAVAPQRR